MRRREEGKKYLRHSLTAADSHSTCSYVSNSWRLVYAYIEKYRYSCTCSFSTHAPSFDTCTCSLGIQQDYSAIDRETSTQMHGTPGTIPIHTYTYVCAFVLNSEMQMITIFTLENCRRTFQATRSPRRGEDATAVEPKQRVVSSKRNRKEAQKRK